MKTTTKRKILIGGIIALIVIIPLLIFLIIRLTTPSQKVSEVPNACPADSGRCSWTSVSGATKYHYVVTDVTTNTQVTSGDNTGLSITFQTNPGHTYKCDVTPVNNCGNGSIGSGNGSCTAPTATPVPTSPPQPTPTVTPTPEIQACNGECNVNADCQSDLICYQGFCRLSENPTSTVCQLPTPTPTPTNTPTPTPTPTVTPTPRPTNTPAPQSPVVNNPPPVVQNPIIPTNTPRPPQPTVIPPTGSIGVTLGIVGGVIVTVLAGAFLLLF